MLIHLMQHGASLPKELDAHQPLSPLGREQVTKSAKAAKILGLRFELVIASRKTRSQQTAEIIARNTGYPVRRIEISDSVKAMADPLKAIAFLREYNGLDSIFIAGHQPSIAQIASHLLVGNDKMNLSITNGGLMQVDYSFSEKKGQLNWALSPSQLALIAED